MAGLKMSVACLSIGSDTLIAAKDEDPSDNDRRFRACRGCGVKVAYRCAHKKLLGGKLRTVRAHYASRPNTPHLTGCCYDVSSVVDQLAATSEGLPPDCQALIDRISYGNIELRLHVIGDEMKRLESATVIESRSVEPVSTKLHTGNSNLSAYLARATQVVRLYFQIEGNSAIKELASRIKIVEGSQRIPWDRFLYDIGSYKSLYKRAISKAGISHMIALVVQPKKVDKSTFLRTVRCHSDPDKPDKHVIPVLLGNRLADTSDPFCEVQPLFKRSLPPEGCYLVIGNVVKCEIDKSGRFHRIYLSLKYASQIASLS